MPMYPGTPFVSDYSMQVSDLTAAGIRTAMPYNWGANVFISIGGLEKAINQLGAWALIAEVCYLEALVKPFLVYAMSLHRARVLDILDGIDVPPEFENRGKYGFLKRAGLLRAEPTSKLGMLFYVDSRTPLGAVSGDLRQGIEDADSTMNRLNDRSLNGEYTSSISYTKPDYIEALIMGHRGRWSPKTVTEINRMLKRLGMLGSIRPASPAVPPRDFITAAWQDLQIDLQAAWEVLMAQAEKDLVMLAENFTPAGHDFDEIYDVMATARSSVVLGFTQRNTNNVLSMVNNHVTATNLGRRGGMTFMEKDALFREFSVGFKARLYHVQQMQRGQNPALRKQFSFPSPTTLNKSGKGNTIYIFRDRKMFDELSAYIATELEDTRDHRNFTIGRIIESFKELSVWTTRDLEVVHQLTNEFPDMAWTIAKNFEAAAEGIIAHGLRLRTAALGLKIPEGGRLEAPESLWKGTPMDWPSRAAKETWGKQKGIISRVREEKKPFRRRTRVDIGMGMDNLAAMSGLESMSMGAITGMSGLSSMTLGASLGNMTLSGGLGGTEDLMGFGQSL